MATSQYPSHVYIVIRGFMNYGGPEVDVFPSREAAEEHARRLGSDVDGDPIVREEVISSETWLDEREDES